MYMYISTMTAGTEVWMTFCLTIWVYPWFICVHIEFDCHPTLWNIWCPPLNVSFHCLDHVTCIGSCWYHQVIKCNIFYNSPVLCGSWDTFPLPLHYSSTSATCLCDNACKRSQAVVRVGHRVPLASFCLSLYCWTGTLIWCKQTNIFRWYIKEWLIQVDRHIEPHDRHSNNGNYLWLTFIVVTVHAFGSNNCLSALRVSNFVSHVVISKWVTGSALISRVEQNKICLV